MRSAIAAKRLVTVTSVAVLACVWAMPAEAARGTTRYFPHRDDELLRADHRNSGAVYVPQRARGDRPRPLVILLHGLNPTAIQHLWFTGGTLDLRAHVSGLIDGGSTAPF